MTDREREIAALVREHADARFEAGFTERVMARVARDGSSLLETALRRQFMRIVPLAAAASLALAAYNLWQGRRAGAGAIDAMLNLPQVTLATAYSPSALYGAAAESQEAQ